MLRDYQQRSIDQLYAWFRDNPSGNPCLVLPTGSGKSHIVAALCKDALQNWPETRVLMLASQKELLEQNAEKMRLHWPGAPIGIYSASVGKRQLGEPITFAGIQSVAKRAQQLGHVDIIIIDECHLVSHKDEGSYRRLIAELTTINPHLRVIGLTATPYRLGHGLITDKPAIFDALVEPVTIEELIFKGHLSVLRSKVTAVELSADGVHKRGGDYIESELQAAVNTDPQNRAVVDEVIARAGERKSWLFFCAGVQHAQSIRDVLRSRGITAECVTGDTPKAERARILEDFKARRITALTNAQVLTTGFDAPGIDLIAMLRATMSPGLYIQMSGRGLRIHPEKTDCLVLDFAGVVATHGPIIAVEPPNKAGKGPPPMKPCPQCQELMPLSTMVCPCCQFAFPPPEKEKKTLQLRDDDIMGLADRELHVTSWSWRVHTSKTSGKAMLAVTYYGALSDAPVSEYLTIRHEGYAGDKAVGLLCTIATKAGLPMHQILHDASVTNDDLQPLADKLNTAKPPSILTYKKDGKFHRVLTRSWSNQ